MSFEVWEGRRLANRLLALVTESRRGWLLAPKSLLLLRSVTSEGTVPSPRDEATSWLAPGSLPAQQMRSQLGLSRGPSFERVGQIGWFGCSSVPPVRSQLEESWNSPADRGFGLISCDSSGGGDAVGTSLLYTGAS